MAVTAGVRVNYQITFGLPSTLSPPAGITLGSRMRLALTCFSNPQAAPPTFTGWTQVASTVNDSAMFYLFERAADAGDVAGTNIYTWTISDSFVCDGYIEEWKSADTSSYTSGPTQNGSTSDAFTDYSGDSETVGTSGEVYHLHLTIESNGGAGAFTSSPLGMTQNGTDATDVFGQAATQSWYEVRSATGATGTRSGTHASARWDAITSVFKNAGAGGATGSTSVALPPITTSAAGKAVGKGTASAALPKIAAALAGLVAATPSGTASIALPKVTAAAAGKIIGKGSASAALPKVAAALTGNVATQPSGSASAALPKVAASLVGKVVGKGSVSVALPKISAAASGALHCTGSAAATLPAFAVSCTGRIPQKGSVSVAIPGIRCSIVGNVAGVYPTFNINGFVSRDRRIMHRRFR